MQLGGRRVIALAQLSDPTLHPKDGCPHLTSGTQWVDLEINGLEWTRDWRKTNDMNPAKTLLHRITNRKWWQWYRYLNTYYNPWDEAIFWRGGSCPDLIWGTGVWYPAWDSQLPNIRHLRRESTVQVVTYHTHLKPHCFPWAGMSSLRMKGETPALVARLPGWGGLGSHWILLSLGFLLCKNVALTHALPYPSNSTPAMCQVSCWALYIFQRD